MDFRVWGYCRVSTDNQTYERQKLEILEYASRNGWTIDRFVHSQVSARKSQKERGVDVLKAAAEGGKVSAVIFSELSRLGRSIGEVCRLVDYFVDDCRVALHFVKESMVLESGRRDISTKVLLSTFSLLAEIERDLISERTRSALSARKAAGVTLGRPRMKSKLDGHEETIRGLLEMGVTQKAIARRVGCCECTLSNWLKRKRKEWRNGARAGK